MLINVEGEVDVTKHVQTISYHSLWSHLLKGYGMIQEVCLKLFRQKIVQYYNF